MITVYTTKNCPNCKALKRILKRAKIPFIEKDLEDSEVNAELIMKNIHVLAAPAIQIGTQVFVYLGEGP